MKKVMLNENGINTVKNTILRESYGDKVELVKKFLDGNFMRATYTTDGDDGTVKNVGVFIKLNNNLPTDKSATFEDVFDMIQDKFANILSDKKERDGFLNQTLKDWYNKKITKNGSLSNYTW